MDMKYNLNFYFMENIIDYILFKDNFTILFLFFIRILIPYREVRILLRSISNKS